MNKSNFWILALILAGAVFCVHGLGAKDMFEVKFVVGENIVETAKKSGAPRWATRNIDGLISYDLVGMPVDVPLVYQRPGFEVNAIPIYSFMMYADAKINNNLAVKKASLLFNTDALSSHASAKTFVENLISQFQRGKWTRYLDDLCPAVTGRSSFLDQAGKLDRELTCALDPGYRLSSDEWILLLSTGGQRYEWLGDGVYAKLNVGYSDDVRGITYSIRLAFEDFAARKRQDEENRLNDLAEGDASGWKSTENETKAIAARKLEIKVLEANALKRGDGVIPR